jgi:hypothetical protein
MKHLQQYQLAYASSEHLVKNHYLSIDKNPTASQKNMENLLTQTEQKEKKSPQKIFKKKNYLSFIAGVVASTG